MSFPNVDPADLVKMAELAEYSQELAAANDEFRSQLEKQAAAQRDYEQQVQHLVDEMANRGIIDYREKQAMEETLKSPNHAVRVFIKLARRVGPVHLGEISDRANVDALDPIARFALSRG